MPNSKLESSKILTKRLFDEKSLDVMLRTLVKTESEQFLFYFFGRKKPAKTIYFDSVSPKASVQHGCEFVL